MAEKFLWQRREDLQEIGARRRPRNKRGFALQLCVLRYSGHLLASCEFVPPDGADFIGRQVDLDRHNLADYEARAETRPLRNHVPIRIGNLSRLDRVMRLTDDEVQALVHLVNRPLE